MEHLEEFEEEFNHIKWDIMGICETSQLRVRYTTLQSRQYTRYQNNAQAYISTSKAEEEEFERCNVSGQSSPNKKSLLSKSHRGLCQGSRKKTGIYGRKLGNRRK